jgi:hypothetical protein
MVLFLLIVIVAIVLGAIGLILKGLLYLLIIGAILFLADLVFLGSRLSRRRRRMAR